MTRKQIVELYGKNVYVIQLELAMQIYLRSDYSVADVWAKADEFIRYMESDNHTELEPYGKTESS